MEQISNLKMAEKDIFRKAKRLIVEVRRASTEDPSNLKSAIEVLQHLRRTIYEDLNQIQHEEMILRAALALQSNEFSKEDMEWYWNPRQTGGPDEPDLRGTVRGQITLSVEVTASENPKGIIDQRMQKTLKKLSQMRGRKIYFVRTETMENRAITKVSKAGYQIEVMRV